MWCTQCFEKLTCGSDTLSIITEARCHASCIVAVRCIVTRQCDRASGGVGGDAKANDLSPETGNRSEVGQLAVHCKRKFRNKFSFATSF